LRSTAHDLRTPLTSLLGYAQLLKRRFDRGEVNAEHLQKPVHVIVAQAQRLDRLTTMLLDITRLEQGSWVFEPAPIDLRHGIEQVVQELHLLIERHSIVTHLPATPLIVEGDDLRFEQIMYNLIQNAIKYSPIGGAITVTARQEARQAVITVRDEGMGIPAQDLPNVFERFYRATNVPHATISGLGLGLYLVKEYVEMLRGAVEVQSSVGEGTTFQITIPLID
jgi:signal transduction histidine kinase